jgi:hypothetical protein
MKLFSAGISAILWGCPRCRDFRDFVSPATGGHKRPSFWKLIKVAAERIHLFLVYSYDKGELKLALGNYFSSIFFI